MPKAANVTRPSNSLLALQDLIESDLEVNMLFSTMFTYKFEDPHIQESPISDYMEVLKKMQAVRSGAPEYIYIFIYNSNLGSAYLNSLFICVMATSPGTMAFMNGRVNNSLEVFWTIGRNTWTTRIQKTFVIYDVVAYLYS